MSFSKHKKSGTQTPFATRASTSIASKPSAMAASAAPVNVNSDGANANAEVSLHVRGDATDTISMPQLVAELAKQRAGLKNDVSGLIQESLKPLQTAMDALRDTVGSFQARLAATEWGETSKTIRRVLSSLSAEGGTVVQEPCSELSGDNLGVLPRPEPRTGEKTSSL